MRRRGVLAFAERARGAVGGAVSHYGACAVRRAARRIIRRAQARRPRVYFSRMHRKPIQRRFPPITGDYSRRKQRTFKA